VLRNQDEAPGYQARDISIGRVVALGLNKLSCDRCAGINRDFPVVPCLAHRAHTIFD
jgi:hypothetical protein